MPKTRDFSINIGYVEKKFSNNSFDSVEMRKSDNSSPLSSPNLLL